MALTRKQAWRRVRVVRHEASAIEADKPPTDTAAAAHRKRPAGDWMRQTAQRQPQHGSPERHQPPTMRADRSDSSSSSNSGGEPASPERNVLDNWRLPREGRDPSARPGVSAARRQAAAACVRVGSRVSFNTVVAAILIPSAKDLHAAAREELWWQETDYRDFRINFIQFMRTPPVAAADGPELVPVEIVAESESESTPGEDEAEERAAVPEGVQQPVVMVDPAVYEGARATEKVCAWPVEEEEAGVEDPAVPPIAPNAAAAAAAATVVVVTSSEPKKSISSFSLSDSDDTSPPTPPSEEPATDGTESDESIETAAGISCAAAASPPHPLPPAPPSSPAASSASLPRNDSDAVGFSTRGEEGNDDDCPTAAPAAEAREAEGLSSNGGAWDEQETNRRGRIDSSGSGGGGSTCCLGWPTADDEGNDADEEKEEEPDYYGNTIRMGRSFSNLETARRGGAGLSTIVPGDSSDADESSDGADSSDGSGGGRGARPRALSLDGWFTCGLENGVVTKTYETHDHAGRLRDLVMLAPIPAVCATPPSNSTLDEQMALNNALRRLGVAFNVSVDRRETSRASDESSGARDGGTKCRADGVDKAVSPGGFGPSPVAAAAVAAAARKRSTLPAPVRPATTTSVKSQQQRVGLDKGNSLTTPVGLGVS